MKTRKIRKNKTKRKTNRKIKIMSRVKGGFLNTLKKVLKPGWRPDSCNGMKNGDTKVYETYACTLKKPVCKCSGPGLRG
jgi:hypothetical protein